MTCAIELHHITPPEEAETFRQSGAEMRAGKPQENNFLI